MSAELGGTSEVRALLEGMWLIRAFEEKVSELYARGEVSGLVHLAIGQEGVAVGLGVNLRADDYLFAGHRAHAHALAKGADPERLLAEICGRSGGYCGGKGGSMHVAAPEVGFVTATGVVAGNLPLALGAAWACTQHDRQQVAVAVFGDGAGQAGAFHETLNIASLWRLPLVLVCENNGYAEFTPLSAHTKVERLVEHAKTYGIPCATVDGNDVLAVSEACHAAVERARGGDGPTFVECLTYRLRGHYEGDPGKYRALTELKEWRDKDPIQRLAEVGTDLQGGLDVEGPTSLEEAMRARIEAAATTALASPPPAPSELTTHVTAW